jgi:hypothetical protein
MTDHQRIAVPLTRTDAWLLAALTDASHDGRFVNLADFVDAYDWLMRAIPTFDKSVSGFLDCWRPGSPM